MQDGQRLNSYITNAVSPDYGISLAKVKQIEVLRGPASSLYGSVALTAVINIVTKDGVDVRNGSISVSAGNRGQLAADLLLGKHDMNMDFMHGSPCTVQRENRFLSRPKNNMLFTPGTDSSVWTIIRDFLPWMEELNCNVEICFLVSV